MTEKEREVVVVIEYFKSLRQEIHLRVQEHTRLVWIKIVSLAAIISCLIGKFFDTIIEGERLASTSPLLYFVWIIPLAAVIFDVLIAENQRVITNLGYYIKKYLENGSFAEFKKDIRVRRPGQKIGKNTFLDWITHPASLTIDCMKRKSKEKEKRRGKEKKTKSQSPFLFWEEAAAQAEIKYHCYTVEDIFVIWLFTLASGSFSVLLRWHVGGFKCWIDYILAMFCIVAVFFALIYLVSSITMERRF